MPGLGYIGFNATIDSNNANQLLGASYKLIAEHHLDRICYLFSTQGGSVADGILLYNSMKVLPVETTIYNMGNVNSIGNAVFLACQIRFTCPHSTFMFNNDGIDIAGTSFERKPKGADLDKLLWDQLKISEIIADETDLAIDEIEKLFFETTTKPAEFALQCGIIRQIRMPDIERDAPFHHLVLK